MTNDSLKRKSLFWPILCCILVLERQYRSDLWKSVDSLAELGDSAETEISAPDVGASGLAQAVQQPEEEVDNEPASPLRSIPEGIRSNMTQQQLSVEALLIEPVSQIRFRVSQWRNDLPSHFARAQYQASMEAHTHDRYFPFEPMAECKNLQEIGRDPSIQKGKYDDDSKQVCGLDGPIFQKEGCIIYSIGGNNEWGFELDLLQRTKCEIHTFDCTGPVERFDKKPDHPRSHFHHVCLSDKYAPAPRTCGHKTVCGRRFTLSQIQHRLNHTNVELLKMDIEGFEIPLFKSWWRGSEDLVMPVQMLVEIHYSTFIPFAKHIRDRWMRPQGSDGATDRKLLQKAPDLVFLNQMLLDMGYVIVSKENNPHCAHCIEVVLVRIPPRLLLERKPYIDKRR